MSRPPQRIVWAAYVVSMVSSCRYATGRACQLARAVVIAAQMWAMTATSSTIRTIQRSHPRPKNGAPTVRSPSA